MLFDYSFESLCPKELSIFLYEVGNINGNFPVKLLGMCFCRQYFRGIFIDSNDDGSFTLDQKFSHRSDEGPWLSAWNHWDVNCRFVEASCLLFHTSAGKLTSWRPLSTRTSQTGAVSNFLFKISVSQFACLRCLVAHVVIVIKISITILTF